MSNGVVTVAVDAGGGATISDVGAAAAQAWFAHAPAGLYVLDTELRIVSAGLATQIMGGLPAERGLGPRLTDVHRPPRRSQHRGKVEEGVGRHGNGAWCLPCGRTRRTGGWWG